MIEQAQTFWDSITLWLDGKKTFLCGLALGLSLIGVAACWWFKLIQQEQAVQLITFFVGVFGGGGIVFQRQATAKVAQMVKDSTNIVDDT